MLKFVPNKSDLKEAIRQNQILPAFQPLVDLKTKKTLGFEILARWLHPAFGMVMPGAFVPLAENSGLIDEMTLQIARHACAELARVDGRPSLAFNISPLQFRHDFIDLLSDTVTQSGLSTSQIEIELTEGVIIDDLNAARDVAELFRDRGFRLSLDDFGTGFSSLTRLHALPFSTLKIDAQFVGAMEADAASRRIVSSVIDLGQSLGLSVVAEGIETHAQLTMLERMGCDIGQGYYLGRPSLEYLPEKLFFPIASVPTHTSRMPRYQRVFQLEASYESSPNAVALLDADGNITRANERFSHLVHLQGRETQGVNIAQLFPDDPSEKVSRILRHLSLGREIRQLEIKDRRLGKVFVVNCLRVQDDEGHFIGFCLSFTDISRLRQVEAILAADEDYARIVANEQRLHVIWAAGRDGKLTYLGPALTARLSTSIDERITDWYSRMHPDDHTRVRKEWLSWIPSGLPFSTRFRVLNGDGQWQEVRSSATPHFDDGGDVTSWTGVIADNSTIQRDGQESSDFDNTLLNLLTGQQLDLLSWVAAGKSNTDIATIAGLSRRGVEYHMEQILKKLGVSSKAQAAALLGSSSTRRPTDK